jgi:hypothetical protein
MQTEAGHAVVLEQDNRDLGRPSCDPVKTRTSWRRPRNSLVSLRR